MTRRRNAVGTGMLLLIFVISAPTSRAQNANSGQSESQSQSQSQYPSQSQTPTLEQCEANPELPECNQLTNGGTASPGQQQGLPNGMRPPSTFTTGPRTPYEQPALFPRFPNKPQPPTEFQLMVANSVGRMLPIYGSSLFRQPPSTFAPLLNVPVPANYVIGPGDELYVQIWGQINVELRASVDRDGTIYIPKVGSVTVAGVQFKDLNEFLRQQIARIYRNFNVAVTLGKLRSIDVYVTGDARTPGRYTISSLSTLVNAVFATGGPSSAGSMRHIELKRDGALIADFDLYDLLLKGDKSNDVQLLPGDVIYIPPVGPQIAVSGSVNVPAIYELRNSQDSLADAIALAGGLNEVADATRLTIERIDKHEVRSVVEYSLGQAASEQVKGGDIIHILSIVPRFDNAVTLRGNVANPGRYPWHQGMRVRDLIPNKEMLLTREYWRAENNLVNGAATDYAATPQRRQRMGSQGPEGSEIAGRALPNEEQQTPMQTENGAANWNAPSNYRTPAGEATQPPSSQTAGPSATQTRITSSRLRTEVKLVAPEINWDYAVIQRLDPVDLSTRLIPFSLRKAVLEDDPAANLALEPGDIVTIFSQKDIAVPETEQTIFVRVEGEVKVPGVYRVKHGQTLQDLLRLAGGVTPNAYLYGAQFTRESARLDQQAALDRTASQMEQQVQELSIANARSNPDQTTALSAQSAAQEALVRELRSAKATGRVVLALTPTADTVAAVPPIFMEDGDSLFVPPKSQVVSVVGTVFNQSSFVYRKGATVAYYLQEAGNGTGNSDIKHVLLVRANGSVLSGSVPEYGWWHKNVRSLLVLPGDTIVIPPKLRVGGVGKAIRDWATVAAQVSVAAAVIAIR
ncbi:MAG: SLBB domain-containing protein [Candidatus Acidiferrales bacterium]